MKHRLIRALVAVALALGAVAVPSGTAPVHAASSTVCTGWTSSVTPPDTIRVYRTARRRTEIVSFRTYVEKVMAAEWGPRTVAPALRAGAITVKQYGWYWTMHWRGGKDAKGSCYDVVDSTRDQLYSPSRTPSPQQLAAIEATWMISLRKGDSFFPTGYRPGTGTCTAHIDGWKLYQQDAVDCVYRYRDTTEWLLRRFYSNLVVSVPGSLDVTGDHHGDAILAVQDPATDELSVRVVTEDRAYATTAARQAARTLDVVAPAAVASRAVGDVDGNGRADLVTLVTDGAGVAVRVMLASAKGFAPAVTWWRSATDPTKSVVPAAGGELRLLVADFNADGLADAGLVRLTDAGTVLLVASSSGKAFAPVRRRLSVSGNLLASRFVAGDFTGDARADLAIQSEVAPPDVAGAAPAAVSTQTRVAASTPTNVLAAPSTWVAAEPVPLADMATLVGDVNRDGRDDLVVIRRTSAGTRILAYRSTGKSFGRSWFRAADASIPFASTRFSLTDWTGDGRSDVVTFRDLGTDADGTPLGTAIRVYASTGTAFSLRAKRQDSSLAWPTFVAY